MVSLRTTNSIAFLTVLSCAGLCSPGGAQDSVRVRVAENLRKEPQGAVLARLRPGMVLASASRRGRWAQVDVDGWVWAPSLQVSRRDGMDLVVSASEGENLRDGPSGKVIGHLNEGMLLAEVERRPGWVHVRRRAWMWRPSLTEVPTAPPRAASPADSVPAGATGAGTAWRPMGYASAGTSGAVILSAPGGDTVGRSAPRAEMEVVAREGSWARVRLEGWTWLPVADSAAGVSVTDSLPLTPAQLRGAPDAYRGRTVTWELQFISLERAEKVRTDFFEGEPFLLARYGGSDGPFVYVAVPKDRTGEMAGLVPLERIVVTGRVRTGASSLTGTPIIDLVSFRRAPAGP